MFLNRLLNKWQNHLFIYNIWINFAKENVCQSLNFLNNFMPNTIKLNFFIIINKVLKWFGGQELSVFPWGLGFNPW
jgi:hypothetical protein